MNWDRAQLNRLIMALAELGEFLILRDLRAMPSWQVENFERVYQAARQGLEAFWEEIDLYRAYVVRPGVKRREPRRGLGERPKGWH